MILERAAGQIVMFAVMASGLVYIAVVPAGLTLPPAVVSTRELLLAGLLVAGIGWFAWRFFHVPGRVRRLASSSRHALFGRSVWLRQLLLGLAIVGCNLATFAFSARATGTPLALAAVVGIVPLILTAMVLPLSIGGWGFREGASAALLPLAGATPAAAVAASVAFGIVILAASLPGALWLIGRNKSAPVAALGEPAKRTAQ